MSRSIPEIIAHLRAVSNNPAISTTLIQTEDLMSLCDAVEASWSQVVLKRTHATDQTKWTLKEAVLAYISECDNPVPDYEHRKTLRNYLRKMVGSHNRR